ncbi:MAG: RNA polymerase sigma factor [Planctomycetota bacterium]
MRATDDHDEEHDLVTRARAGESAAFDTLALAHQARLQAAIARFIREPADVYDLLQETLFQAWRGLERFDTQRDFGRWLRGIGHKVVADHLRRVYRQNRNGPWAMDAEMLELLTGGSDPAFDAARSDDALEAVRSCIQNLAEDKRRIVLWRFAQGRKVRWIAAKMARKENAVSMALARITELLRICVEGKLREVSR